MCAMMQKLRTRSRSFTASEAEAERKGERRIGVRIRRPGPAALLPPEIGLERGEVRVDVGVGHREEMRRDAPPDPGNLPIAVRLGLQIRLVPSRGVARGGCGRRAIDRVVLAFQLA